MDCVAAEESAGDRTRIANECNNIQIILLRKKKHTWNNCRRWRFLKKILLAQTKRGNGKNILQNTVRVQIRMNCYRTTLVREQNTAYTQRP